MILQDRDYQTECVNSIYNYFATKEGNPVCALPTGTGKSVIIARFLETIYRAWPTQKVMVLTHVKELIRQNYSKLLLFWPGAPAGINSAGLGKRDIHNRIIFAGIASVAKYGAQFGNVDLIIIDECHLVSPTEETMYQLFIAALKSINPRLKVIGFTATPYRLGHGRITEDGIFTDICFDITGMEAFNRLIAEGYLAQLIPKKTELLLSTDGVHMRGGEFIPGELQTAVNKEEITERALKEAIASGQDRNHWLIFAAGVEHAIAISEMLNYFGVSCVAIHSKMGDSDRDKGIADWKAGKYRAAVNNNILTTGIDFPAIDLILVLRPTASSVLWVQMLGRGTRPSPGKVNCLVLDFAGNTRRLGPINDPVIPRKKGEKGGDAPVKLCDVCSTWNHASVRFCVCCGHEFIFLTKLKANASTESLIKGELPVVKIIKVDHITYSEHLKQGSKPTIKMTYYCGLRHFNEFLCPEHSGYPLNRSRILWRARCDVPLPSTTAEAMVLTETLKPPTHLRIWMNTKDGYPEILAHCFDGTAFGTETPSDSDEGPTVDVRRRTVKVPAEHRVQNSVDVQPFDLDDDIPF